MTAGAYLNRGNLTYYERRTLETIRADVPVVFQEHFFGKELMATEVGSTGIWDTVQVNLNAAIALLSGANGANGVCALALDADNNAEDAVLYWGDVRSLNLAAGLAFETRLRVPVLPTGEVAAVWGVAGDHNLDKDTITEGAWFRLDGSGALKVETDDTTNNNDDVATGITLVAGDYHTYRIDFGNLAKVKFYVDGVGVAEATAFDMSNLTAGEAVMQPYYSLDKGATTDVGSLWVDRVLAWSNSA